MKVTIAAASMSAVAWVGAAGVCGGVIYL